jgi:hypothetical protein
MVGHAEQHLAEQHLAELRAKFHLTATFPPLRGIETMRVARRGSRAINVNTEEAL